MTAKVVLQRCLLLGGSRTSSSLTRQVPALAQFHSTGQRKVEFSIQDTDDFTEKVMNQKEKLTVVDFHASWCGPCKLLEPRLSKALENLGDRVNLARVDIDDNADLAMEYNVSSVPTVFFFKGGSRVDKFVGVVEQDRIEHYIEKYM